MIKVETLPEELQECVRKLNYVLSRQQPEAIAALLTNVDAFYKLTVLSEGFSSDQHPETRSDIAIQEDLDEAIGELGESAEKRETGGT